jgi:Chitin binding Peritrophin-A domain
MEQVWHYCSQIGDMDSFLCANGTIFSQERRTCQWWYDTDCAQTNKFMNVNEDLYIVPTTTKAPATDKSVTPLKKLQQAAGF